MQKPFPKTQDERPTMRWYRVVLKSQKLIEEMEPFGAYVDTEVKAVTPSSAVTLAYWHLDTQDGMPFGYHKEAGFELLAVSRSSFVEECKSNR